MYVMFNGGSNGSTNYAFRFRTSVIAAEKKILKNGKKILIIIVVITIIITIIINNSLQKGLRHIYVCAL